MWKLQTLDKNATKRIYTNTITESECMTEVIYTDAAGYRWWSFVDLFTLPIIREVAARKVTDLYTASITKTDIDEFLNKQKTILRSNDPEKYDKLMSEVLNFESAVSNVSDPTRNLLSLCTVYVMSDDERPDAYDLNLAMAKMDLWKEDTDAMVFFLNWLTDTINSFLSASAKVSQIVSKLQEGLAGRPSPQFSTEQ